MRLLILNGPNLNLLGTREVSIYGDKSFEAYLDELRAIFPEHTIDYLQSNLEGELVTHIQSARHGIHGLIINPGGYAHTSVAITDALAILDIPVVEVHISQVYKREPFRHTMLTATRCSGVITGFGLHGYELAIRAIAR